MNLNIKDVPGAQAATKKRGITTERKTNPNWPEYQFPGQSELKNQYNNPYGKTAFDEKIKYSKNNYLDASDKHKNKGDKITKESNDKEMKDDREVKEHDVKSNGEKVLRPSKTTNNFFQK